MTIVLDKVIEELITQKVIALVQTVEDNVKLVRGIDSEIKDLSSDIETFNARLVEASKNPRANDHQVLRVVVKKFTTLVNEAQDTIANYFALKKKHGDDVLSKSFDKIPFCGKINVYANEIQSIRANLDKINKVHENELLYLMKYKMKDRNKAETTLQVRPPIEKNKVLGFEEDFQIIKKHFLEASKNFIVIPIVGMAGTGKTTFASMIFEDPEIHRNSLRIWVHVTKLCDRKQKFISIIYQITKDTGDFSTMTEEMLEGKIKILLKDQTYFIVLDDVWEKKDWQSLKDAFPENLNGSKVLVTSRYGNVVDSKWNSHHLGKLTNEDGWSVIKNNVFSAEECSDKLLEKLGKKIARKCNGLPLALVVVAGILRRCVTSDDWRRVAENPLLEINRDDQNYHELVKLSYDDLPHEKLKNCFLYFAYFPMGHEIATWKLIRLWIAEEFIPTIDEWGYSLDAEIEAQKYLNDLIDANLVMVIKRRADGQTKTCRIHDTLYEFCKSEAARKNLFLLMEEGQRLDENTSSTRRLCFHSFTTHIFDAENKSSRLFLNCYNKRSLSPFGKHIHSLLLSSPQKSETPFKQDQLAAIPNTFPLLRVLNIENIKFNDLLDKDLANELYSLYLLKYLAISGNLNVLPKSFRSLRELETLVIKTTARTLQIEGGIWNMEKLRHVCTNTSAQLPFPPQTNCKTNSGGKDIHTLSTISPASCREEIFNKTPNLRKLGVRGNLIELFEEKENICLFNNLQKLKCLVNLKLYGQYDKVLTVPMLDKFASRLKKLSFSGTLFEWKDMAVLGSLEELEVLKLGDYAFKGETWELSNDVVFIRLQYLRIGRTNLVTWKATEDSFPALQNLILRNCNVIKRIPEVFAKVHTLKVMELFHVSESATRSIKEVQENVKNGGFKLIIITSQKREGAMTAARDTLIEQAVSEAVNHLVKYVEQRLRFENGGLDWEIKNLISDIETFNARLEEAYKNPNESVNVLIVKNFQTIVNEACDAVDNQRTMYFDHKDKTFIRKFLVPHYRREVKSCETEIQSVRTKVNTIDNEHKEELETLTNYDKPPLIFQIEKSTVYDGVIEAIEKVVNMLHQKIEGNVNIVSEIKDMTSQIKTFTDNLVKACKNPKANEHRVLKVIVKKFQILVNETMNTVTKYFAQEKKNGKNALAKSLDKIAHCGKPNAYASEIQSIKKKVNKISEDHTKDLLHILEEYNKLRDMPVPKVRPPIEKNKVLGFKKDFETIKDRFLLASKNFIVIPIVGMAGTGKTTIASMIFEDPDIHSNSLRIWVHVTKHCDRKQKFISIIYQITKHTEDFSTMTEEMLEGKIKTLLKDQTYFIVLDDVWKKKDWQSLKDAFPENLNGSKVLVTCRYRNVVDSKWNSHNLGKLSNGDSWLVIQNNVFGTEGCNDKLLEELGKKIARKCKGLPLALVVVAGILRRCVTSDDWRRVAENPLLKINREDQSNHELVKLSYDYLPHEKLKNCFLYFAYFPMGHEIATWKLIRLWIAEEFIPTIDEWGYPLDAEVEAQKYLNDLIDANLVMVIKKRADGQTKTCRVHDTLYEFCQSEAARKNLFLLMDEGQRLDENISSTRRVCFHSFTANIFDAENKSSRLFLNCCNQRSLSPSGKHIHSLLLSSPQKSETTFKQDQLAAIANTFPLLRVLNIEYIKFNDSLDKDLVNELYSLYLLKYLAISGNLNVLPKSFRSLRELETLVIKTTARTLQIEGGIWNMEKLRHVRTNTSAQLPFPLKTNSKTNSGGKDIHTLSTISPASCTKEIFSKTPNLQKLGVRGNILQLFEEKGNICLFDNLQLLKCLVNLKLYGQYDKVLPVPILDKFARWLKKLSFSGTLFEWKDMEVLGKLEELEVLKLDDYAFKGENWELSNNVVFRRLQYLRIGRTNLVTWKATENSFPALQSLILRNCNVIERIPEAFARVHTLKVMELFHVSVSAIQSVKKVQENITNGGFKLIIITSQKREGPITAARDTLIEQAVSEAVNNLVGTTELCGFLENSSLEWLIKKMTFDIKTFNARLEEAYKNPTESVNILIVKNFQTIVNEAQDAVENCWRKNLDHEDKTFIKNFLVPRYRREVKSCESEIQSVRTKVNMIDREHKKELETLCNYENNAPLIFQKSTVYDRAIEGIEQKVNMLHQKVEENVNGVCDIVSEIKDMTSLIKMFTEDLVKACKNPKANEHRVLKVIVNKFGILVIETLNAVTNYFAQEKKYGNNVLAKSLDKIAHCGKPNAYASEIQSIKEKVKRISKDHTIDLLHLSEDYNKLRDMPVPKVRAELRENKMVGFDNDDLKTIKTRLMEASEDFFVIPIVGNAGIGKTTFALKVFEDLEIREYFTHCVWLPVSRGFQRKQKFIDILHQISNQTEDFSTVLEDVLEAKIKEILEDKRYLIVLDDVWEKEAWDSLKVAFPTNMKGSRVLVTTLSGNAVDSTWKSHSLGKLSNDDGWLLIKNIVFGTKGWCDTKIEELGIKIAEKCNGLPHALVLVAGILSHRITSAGWQRVADNPLLEIKGEDQRYHELIKLSYYDLPDERLKRCFLYFACFPMGHEIVAWKLICLWIAEYFIPTEDDWGPLDKEVEASNYLNVLINRNLVIVKKRSADGQIKTCCIHDTLHEFCRREAERINLFHVMDEGQRLNARIRLERLCSYYTMNIVDEENNNPSDSFSNLFNKRMGPHQDGEFLHSLLLSSSQKSEIHSTPEQLETILKTFKYLKVLSIESLKFSSLPNYFPLYFMRYLAIIGDISSLPKSLEHLSRLETLVIKTTERALQINGGIWNMEELRHVHTNTSTQLPCPPKTGKHGCKQIDIRTLSTISPGSCTNEIFNMTPKLQKLGVRGDLSELLEEKQNVCLFNNLQMLECLENLKLHGNSKKVKLKVPMSDKFPRRLRKLTLSATLFQWNDMSVLGLLDRLKVLKLDDNAFSGEDWDLSSDVIFKGLQYLRIGKTNLKTWTVVEPEKSFPVLETLVLKNCISLQNIPQGFANVDSLELIELFDVSKKVADFAREICEKRHGKTNVKINGFITPLPSQATVHNLAYEYEYVNTSGFDYPNTSTSSQEIEHNQAYGDENVNTNGFEHPSTSTLSEEIVHKQSNGDENVNISGFDHPSTSTSSQEIVHKQSNWEKNVNSSGFDHPNTSTLSQEIVSDDD